MKPDWKDAPEWAQWLHMDGRGQWLWTEYKPVELAATWSFAGRYALAGQSVGRSGADWYDTLEPRPTIPIQNHDDYMAAARTLRDEE